MSKPKKIKLNEVALFFKANPNRRPFVIIGRGGVWEIDNELTFKCLTRKASDHDKRSYPQLDVHDVEDAMWGEL